VSRIRFLAFSVTVMAFTLIACGTSSESTGGSTGSSASPEVTFPDELIEEKIRLNIKLPKGPILASELEKLTEFSMALDLYVDNLTGLERLVNLQDFDLTQNKTVDISPLASLTNLTRLNLTQNDIVDVTALAPLTNLTFLWIQDNEVVDISALGSLTNLIELNLQKNQITDISAISSMANLEILNLTSNNISDLSPLTSLSNITLLELSKNQITDISPLLNSCLGEGATSRLWGEKLDANSVDVVIPQLKAAGVKVQF